MSGLTVKQLGKSLLDDFHYDRRIAHIRLGDQEVKVLGHDDVADHHKSIFLPCTLQNAQEEIAARAGSQLRPPLVAATGYEVEIVPAVPAFQTFRHNAELSYRPDVWSVMRRTEPRDLPIPLIRKPRMSGAPGGSNKM